MERLDPTTNAHILEEVPEIQPRDATQWIFEGGVPFITYGCARTNVGTGDYLHKEKVRRVHRSQRMRVNISFSKAPKSVPRRRKGSLARRAFRPLGRTGDIATWHRMGSRSVVLRIHACDLIM